jgi:hypothetical protein
MEIREHPPPLSKTSMVSPLGGDAESWECPPFMSKTSMAAPLGGDDGDPRAPTTIVRDVNGGSPRRQRWKIGSAHHLCQRHEWWAPGPCVGSDPHPRSKKCVVTCMSSIDKSNSADGSHSPCAWSCYVL